MQRTVIACVGSSLLTVGLLTVLGAGPLTPPPGPIAPTSVSLNELADAIGKMSPGLNIPGRTFTNGGTVTLAASPGQPVTIPLIGYSVERAVKAPHSSYNAEWDVKTASQLQYYDQTLVTIVIEAGRYGGSLPARWGNSSTTIHLVGSDGTVVNAQMILQYSRRLTNGPTPGGNKAIDIVTFEAMPTITDPSGTGPF